MILSNLMLGLAGHSHVSSVPNGCCRAFCREKFNIDGDLGTQPVQSLIGFGGCMQLCGCRELSVQLSYKLLSGLSGMGCPLVFNPTLLLGLSRGNWGHGDSTTGGGFLFRPLARLRVEFCTVHLHHRQAGHDVSGFRRVQVKT